MTARLNSSFTRFFPQSIGRFAACAALGLCTVFTAACSRNPAQPYPRAFTLSGTSPRVLQASQEIAFPMVVGNTGQLAWDPARVHLSYHWLWFVPRELASRTRTLPYHDGIRTDLVEPVAPGGLAPVHARLLAPQWPGLYWLQWDIVEEGVTWFAQVSPRHPRTLVVVVPPIAGLLAPLPLLVALIGVIRLKSDTMQVPPPAALYAWCAACLFAKPFMLFHEALLEPTAVAYWLVLVAAVVPPTLVAVVLPKRLRTWALLAIGVSGSLLVLADLFYYRFFGDVLSTPAMLAMRQAGRVWGSVRSLFTADLVWLIADCPVAGWLALRSSMARRHAEPIPARAPVAAGVAVAVAGSVMFIAAPRVLQSTTLDQTFRDRAVVEQLGVFGFHAFDVWNYVRSTWLRPAVTEAEIASAEAWFDARAPLRAGGGPNFGVARGKNLIVIQVESLQDFVVDYRVGDEEVMPHLAHWTSDAVRFTNVTDQTSQGRTSDAEFTMLASLLPLDQGAVAFRFPANHYVTLPRVLSEDGYHTLSAVPFEAGFWNRRVTHPAYGFDRSLFEPDFQMTEQIGWGLNDRDFLRQMIPHLATLPRPFCAWLITLSLHHPFADFPAAHKMLKLGALEGTPFGNYLHTMRFFDQALERFVSALAREGLLDESVVVVFGDHDAGFPRTPATARAMHIGNDDASWALNDRVPVFMRFPGAHGVSAVPAGQTDIAPTLLTLLGLDPSPLPFVGRNLFARHGDEPVPRPNGEWLDGRHLFLAHGATHVCYNIERRAVDADAACRPADERARREHDISRLVVLQDLQQRLSGEHEGSGR